MIILKVILLLCYQLFDINVPLLFYISLSCVQNGCMPKLFYHCVLINGKNALSLPTLKLANIGSTRCKTLKKFCVSLVSTTFASQLKHKRVFL